MSLKKKHEIALESKDYLQQQTQEIFDKIKKSNTGSCWHIEESYDYYQKEALRLDSLSPSEKEKMPLYGLTLGVKDLFCVEGMTTTSGSEILKNFKAPYDSTVVKTLKDKGSIVTAKLAMDEFAMGSFSNTSYLGKTSLSTDQSRSAGGSSGGSGSALQEELVDFTIGSDTGGSVRLPAAFCSQVGYKPSYGAFSRYGMIAYASSLDQAGFLTHTTEDMKYLLDSHISQYDPKDMTSHPIELLSVEKKRLKIGYFPHLMKAQDIQEDIRESYSQLCENLKREHELVSVEIPYMDKAAQIYYVIACSEASSNLARYQGVFFGTSLIEEKFQGTYWEQCAQYRSKYFGSEVQKRIMLGSFILSSEKFDAMYKKATDLRKALSQEFEKLFTQLDMLILPTSPMVAPKWIEIDKMTSTQIYLSDFMTVPFSLAGLPVFSMPWFTDKQNLGIGIQCVGAKYKDYNLLTNIMQLEKTIKKI